MDEQQIEELLEHVVLPPVPESLDVRVAGQAREAARRGFLLARIAWHRVFEAAATLALVAGAAGSAR